MEQSPPIEANSHSASQQIPRFLWSQKDHDRVHKSPPLASFLTQMNSVYNLPACFRYILIL